MLFLRGTLIHLSTLAIWEDNTRKGCSQPSSRWFVDMDTNFSQPSIRGMETHFQPDCTPPPAILLTEDLHSSLSDFPPRNFLENNPKTARYLPFPSRSCLVLNSSDPSIHLLTQFFLVVLLVPEFTLCEPTFTKDIEKSFNIYWTLAMCQTLS